MSLAAYCWMFASVLFTTWHTSLVCGQTLPPPGILYVREFTTVRIPWTYTYTGKVIYEIKWWYQSSVADPPIHIYSVHPDGRPVLNQTSPGNKFKGRLEYVGRDTMKDATLAVKTFRTQDEGIFVMHVIGAPSLPKVQKTVQVIVLSNVTEFKANVTDIKEGDDVVLSCKVTKGLPSPRIGIWKSNRKLNESIASNVGVTTLNYFIKGISPDSSGSYVCTVTTDGRVSSDSTTLDVKYPPKVPKSPKMLYGCIGEMIQLNCEARGNPKPKISVIRPDGTTTDMLMIELKKFGTYRCEAKNNLGNASHAITVSQAKERPEQPSFSQCQFESLAWEKLSEGIILTLQFKEQNSEGPWRDVITTQDTSYSLKNNDLFSDKKDYEFRLLAANCIGNKTSETCSVEGNIPSAGKQSSSNAGLIAGVVIGVLIVILIIVIIVVILKKRGTLPVRNRKERKQINDPSTAKPLQTNSHKPDQLLYTDLARDEDASSERPVYSEIAEPENPEASTYSNSVPSWV